MSNRKPPAFHAAQADAARRTELQKAAEAIRREFAEFCSDQHSQRAQRSPSTLPYHFATEVTRKGTRLHRGHTMEEILRMIGTRVAARA